MVASASMAVHYFAISLDSGLLSRLRRPVGGLNPELLGVLGVQSLPLAELHGVGTDQAADGSSAEKMIQNIETNVPSSSTHCDEAVSEHRVSYIGDDVTVRYFTPNQR